MKNLNVFAATGFVYNEANKKIVDNSELIPEYLHLYMRARFLKYTKRLNERICLVSISSNHGKS